MTTAPNLTVPQMVLLAAGRLGDTFSFAELTVEAWRSWPDAFRLGCGTLDHPDALKVSYTLMGERGLVKSGWITKVGEKQYALSGQGRDEVSRLASAPKRAKLARRRTTVVRRLPLAVDRAIATALASKAFRMYQMGLVGDVSWLEAIKFWGNTVLAARFSSVLEETIEKNEPEFLLRDRQVVSKDDLLALRVAHTRLWDKFARQLERA
jgi:hypothetical protein